MCACAYVSVWVCVSVRVQVLAAFAPTLGLRAPPPFLQILTHLENFPDLENQSGPEASETAQPRN